ncbi:MAG: hypothetical protein JSS72_01575 [Armatimonadetes bacterium]|nr:hypothetical protein [Armatimonadota bacterium]
MSAIRWYRLLLFSPAIVIAGVAVRSNIKTDPFEFVQLTPAQQIGLASYRPLLKETSDALQFHADYQITERLVNRWQEKAEHDSLICLQPIAADDTTAEGAKGEVIRAESKLANQLLDLSAQTQDHDQALKGALTTLRFGEAYKYCDLASFVPNCLIQRRAIACLTKLQLSPSERLVALKELKKVRGSVRSPETLIRERQAFLEKAPDPSPQVLAERARANGENYLAHAQTDTTSRKHVGTDAFMEYMSARAFARRLNRLLDDTIRRLQAADRP